MYRILSLKMEEKMKRTKKIVALFVALLMISSPLSNFAYGEAMDPEIEIVESTEGQESSENKEEETIVESEEELSSEEVLDDSVDAEPPTTEDSQVEESAQTEENIDTETHEPIEEIDEIPENPMEEAEEDEGQVEETIEEVEKKEMVDLSFDTLGGPVLEKVTIEKGSILSELPQPEREGYTFDGWSLESDGDLLNLPMAIEKDMTFFALWEKDYPYKNPDGLYGPMEATSVSFN